MTVKGIFILLTVTLLTANCSAQSVPEFDENSAYNYLLKQCDFGPRNPGSEGHEKCLHFLTSELRKYADNVKEQKFRYPLRKGEEPVTMTNVIANFNSRNPDRILLFAHWDTRPWADMDPDPAKHDTPIIGANDGASGVAILLEIARLIHMKAPPYGIDILLVDGEDYGSYGDNDSWAIGSREFARNKSPNYRPRYGILLDLVGDRNLEIYIERFSYRYAPHIVDKIWARAEELGVVEFIPEPKFEVMDDHVRLMEAGIPCVDIIDFDYEYWHTVEDTPDKCSAGSLGKVGRVVTSVIYEK